MKHKGIESTIEFTMLLSPVPPALMIVRRKHVNADELNYASHNFLDKGYNPHIGQTDDNGWMITIQLSPDYKKADLDEAVAKCMIIATGLVDKGVYDNSQSILLKKPNEKLAKSLESTNVFWEDTLERAKELDRAQFDSRAIHKLSEVKSEPIIKAIFKANDYNLYKE